MVLLILMYAYLRILKLFPTFVADLLINIFRNVIFWLVRALSLRAEFKMDNHQDLNRRL